ncbi:MAG: hypothetical protein CMI02_12920 [Oceanospirillaceae bacterium]|nr:hypothetical protein [Oceanospirillaceae bacterium]MBT12923.1 hypothetical protein [Oceanospirillaceae bacterium]
MAVGFSWSLFSATKHGADQRCLGIELHNSQAFAVYSDQGGVRLCYTPKEGEQGMAGLEQWIADNRLSELPVVISLDSLDYELHLLEAPAVADDELSAALQFRIRDIISRPVSDVIVQGFRLPSDAYRGRMDMAFAVVAEREVVRQLVSWCERLELTLELITVPELSLLNLLADYAPDGSIGVLRLDASDGMIYLYREGALYLARHLHTGAEVLSRAAAAMPAVEDGLTLATDHSDIDAVALELQRSLDFFDSQQGMGMVSEIWVLHPDEADISAVLPVLEASINVSVRHFALPVSAAPGAPSDEQEQATLTASLAAAYGGILARQQMLAAGQGVAV